MKLYEILELVPKDTDYTVVNSNFKEVNEFKALSYTVKAIRPDYCNGEHRLEFQLKTDKVF